MWTRGPAFVGYGAISGALFTNRSGSPGSYGQVSNNRTFIYQPTGGTSFAAAWHRTIGARSGRKYYEMRINTNSPTRAIIIGFSAQSNWSGSVPEGYEANPTFPGIYCAVVMGGGIGVGLVNNGVLQANASYGASIGSVIGVAVDFAVGMVWFSINNAWVSGDPALGASPTFSGISAASDPYVTFYGSTGTQQITTNWNEADFEGQVPAGFSVI